MTDSKQLPPLRRLIMNEVKLGYVPAHLWVKK